MNRVRHCRASVTIMAVLLYAVVSLAQDTEGYRIWTDKSGRFKTEAKIVGYEEGLVSLEKKDGKQIKVPLTKLSFDDRAYLREWLKSVPSEPTPVPEGSPPNEARTEPDEDSTPINPELDVPIGNFTRLTVAQEISGKGVLGGTWTKRPADGKRLAVLYVTAAEEIKLVPFSDAKCELEDTTGKRYACQGIWNELGLISGVGKMSAFGSKDKPVNNRLIFEIPPDKSEFKVLYDGREVATQKVAD